MTHWGACPITLVKSVLHFRSSVGLQKTSLLSFGSLEFSFLSPKQFYTTSFWRNSKLSPIFYSHFRSSGELHQRCSNKTRCKTKEWTDTIETDTKTGNVFSPHILTRSKRSSSLCEDYYNLLSNSVLTRDLKIIFLLIPSSETFLRRIIVVILLENYIWDSIFYSFEVRTATIMSHQKMTSMNW